MNVHQRFMALEVKSQYDVIIEIVGTKLDGLGNMERIGNALRET